MVRGEMPDWRCWGRKLSKTHTTVARTQVDSHRTVASKAHPVVIKFIIEGAASHLPFSHAGRTFRRAVFPSSSSTQDVFWDVFSCFAAQTTTVTHCAKEPKERGKVGQKAAKLAAGSRLWHRLRAREVLMWVLGARRLAQLLTGWAAMAGPVKPLIEETREEKDSFHRYYRKPWNLCPQRLVTHNEKISPEMLSFQFKMHICQ